jgi:hypothetical protein
VVFAVDSDLRLFFNGKQFELVAIDRILFSLW